MVTYRKRRRSYAWLIGLMVFALAMTITFSDVYGLERFDCLAPGNSSTIAPDGSGANSGGFPVNGIAPECPSTDWSLGLPSIPEPATLTLLMLGCGFIVAGRMKRKH